LKISYVAMEKLSNQYAHLFLSEDLRPGHTAVIFMENSMSVVASFLGVLKCGATPVLLNPSAKNTMVVLKHLVQTNVRARMVIFDRSTESIAREAEAEVKFNDKLLAKEGSEGSGIRCWLPCDPSTAADQSDRAVNVESSRLFRGGIPRADPRAVCCRSYSGQYTDIDKERLEAQMMTHCSFIQFGESTIPAPHVLYVLNLLYCVVVAPYVLNVLCHCVYFPVRILICCAPPSQVKC
jgi:non-ribosomal peptide synthetase component E (peptide arylation enzyme)